jgi:hypothetical protein
MVEKLKPINHCNIAPKMLWIILFYGSGMVVAVTGACMIPTRAPFITQPNESIEEASVRANAEYYQIIMNSVAIRLCFAGCGLIVGGILLHLRKAYLERQREVQPLPLPAPRPAPRPAPLPAPLPPKRVAFAESPPAQPARPVIEVIRMPPNWRLHT